jgi:hypothetical protein
VSEDVDRFGLPVHIPVSETPGQMARRKAQFRYRLNMLLPMLFEATKRHLGPVEARQIFERHSKLPRQRQKGSGTPECDAALLAEYDADSERGRPSPKAIAHRVFINGSRFVANAGTDFGMSPEAIEKTLQRLLRQRKKKLADQAELGRQFDELLRNDPGLAALYYGPGRARGTPK